MTTRGLFNKLLWCEDCGKGNAGLCDTHGKLKVVSDRVIPPLARLSVPQGLCVKAIDVDQHGCNVYAVYSRNTIPRRVQYGPLVSPTTDQRSLCIKRPSQMQLMLLREDGHTWCDLTDDTKCNWMTYLTVDTDGTHNAVVYQYQNHIYIVTVQTIPPNEELRVKYASQYAADMKAVLEYESLLIDTDVPRTSDVSSNPTTLKSTGPVRRQKKTPRKLKCPKKLESSVKSENVEHNVLSSNKSAMEKLSEIMSQNRDEDSNLSEADPFGSTLSEPQENVLIQEILGQLSEMRQREENPDKPQKPKVVRRKLVKKPVSFGCSMCGKVLFKKRAYNAHMSTHADAKVYVCIADGCNKSFKSKYKLSRHSVIHYQSKDFTCKVCSREFNRSDHLRSHMAHIHSQERQTHKCNVCHKEYNSLLAYKAHMALHVADRGVTVCQICNRVFDNKSDLVFHIRVHSGSNLTKTSNERKHTCPYCPKKFYTGKDVQRHLLVHTKVRNNLCQFCPLRFGRKDHLLRHIKSVHGEKICDMTLPDDMDDTTLSSTNLKKGLPKNYLLQKKIFAVKASKIKNVTSHARTDFSSSGKKAKRPVTSQNMEKSSQITRSITDSHMDINTTMTHTLQIFTTTATAPTIPLDYSHVTYNQSAPIYYNQPQDNPNLHNFNRKSTPNMDTVGPILDSHTNSNFHAFNQKMSSDAHIDPQHSHSIPSTDMLLDTLKIKTALHGKSNIDTEYATNYHPNDQYKHAEFHQSESSYEDSRHDNGRNVRANVQPTQFSKLNQQNTLEKQVVHKNNPTTNQSGFETRQSVPCDSQNTRLSQHGYGKNTLEKQLTYEMIQSALYSRQSVGHNQNSRSLGQHEYALNRPQSFESVQTSRHCGLENSPSSSTSLEVDLPVTSQNTRSSHESIQTKQTPQSRSDGPQVSDVSQSAFESIQSERSRLENTQRTQAGWENNQIPPGRQSQVESTQYTQAGVSGCDNRRSAFEKHDGYDIVMGYLDTLKFLDHLPTNPSLIDQCEHVSGEGGDTTAVTTI